MSNNNTYSKDSADPHMSKCAHTETKGIHAFGTKPCPVGPRLSLIIGARWPLRHLFCQNQGIALEDRLGQAKKHAHLNLACFPNLPLDFRRGFPNALAHMFASRWSDLRRTRTNNRSSSCRHTLNYNFGRDRPGPLSLSWVFFRAPGAALLLCSCFPSEGDGKRLACYGAQLEQTTENMY